MGLIKYIPLLKPHLVEVDSPVVEEVLLVEEEVIMVVAMVFILLWLMPIFDELDDSSRPRERLEKAGSILELSDEELLGLLIRIGRQGKNAVEVGKELKEAFGSVRNMVYADWRQIANKHVLGVGKVKAMELAAAFELARRGAKLSSEDYAKPVETARDVFEHVRALGVSDMQEHFFALYLDPKKRLLCSKPRSLSLRSRRTPHR